MHALALTTTLLALAGCGPALSASAPASSAPAASCATTPLAGSAFAGIAGLETIPWMKLQPASSGITAHLFWSRNGNMVMHDHGVMPRGANTKILWILGQPNGAPELTVAGTSAGQSFKQTFATVGAGQYPSIVDVPAPGCWTLHVQAGAAQGAVTFEVAGG